MITMVVKYQPGFIVKARAVADLIQNKTAEMFGNEATYKLKKLKQDFSHPDMLITLEFHEGHQDIGIASSVRRETECIMKQLSSKGETFTIRGDFICGDTTGSFGLN